MAETIKPLNPIFTENPAACAKSFSRSALCLKVLSKVILVAFFALAIISTYYVHAYAAHYVLANTLILFITSIQVFNFTNSLSKQAANYKIDSAYSASVAEKMSSNPDLSNITFDSTQLNDDQKNLVAGHIEALIEKITASQERLKNIQDELSNRPNTPEGCSEAQDLLNQKAEEITLIAECKFRIQYLRELANNPKISNSFEKVCIVFRQTYQDMMLTQKLHDSIDGSISLEKVFQSRPVVYLPITEQKIFVNDLQDWTGIEPKFDLFKRDEG